MLAYNFHQLGTSYNDKQISTKVATIVNSSQAFGSGPTTFTPTLGGNSACDPGAGVTTPPTGLNATCAWYTEEDGSLLLWQPGAPAPFVASHAVQVGSIGTGTLPPVCPPATPPDLIWGSHCTAGTSVVPYYSHDTMFMRVIGQDKASERASATSIFAPIISVQDSGIAHYAVWSPCSVGDPTTVDIGDTVILRSNSYKSQNTPACPTPPNLVPNDFKGFFHNPTTSLPGTSANGGPAPPQSLICSATTKIGYTELDYFCAIGGNTIGNEKADMQILHDSYASCQPNSTTAPCKPVLVPVMDEIQGATAPGCGIPCSPSKVDMHIAAWVTVIPQQDVLVTPTSQDWTGLVVDYLFKRGSWGCATPPCPNPPPGTPLAINLLH
jgi:hypothetical protein